MIKFAVVYSIARVRYFVITSFWKISIFSNATVLKLTIFELIFRYFHK